MACKSVRVWNVEKRGTTSASDSMMILLLVCASAANRGREQDRYCGGAKLEFCSGDDRAGVEDKTDGVADVEVQGHRAQRRVPILSEVTPMHDANSRVRLADQLRVPSMRREWSTARCDLFPKRTANLQTATRRESLLSRCSVSAKPQK